MLHSFKRWVLARAALGLALTGLAASALSAGPQDRWRRIENPAPVVGADGLPHTATCSAYPGTDPTFRFWTRKGRTNNLVVYFEGGGACWDDVSCTFPMGRLLPSEVPQFYSPAIPRAGSPRDVSGLFDETRTDNPVKDWTVVYIPYCTGDIHLGSTTRTYNDVGHPLYDLPAQFEIRHRGFDNFMVVLDWIQRNVRTPSKVLVTGVSAGGYGATGNFPWVAQAFPQAELTVLADASQGVTTPGFDNGTPGRNSWNPQLAPWVFGDGAVPGPELMRRGARAYPSGRFAQYTTVTDSVQVAFYDYMEQFYGPGGSCPNPVTDWNQQMLATLASYTSELTNFGSYVAPGSDHTILRSPGFYTDAAAGLPVSQWLGALLNRDANARVSANAACPDCLTPLPCP